MLRIEPVDDLEKVDAALGPPFVAASSACIMSFASRELGEIAVITFAISLFTAICSIEARD